MFSNGKNDIYNILMNSSGKLKTPEMLTSKIITLLALSRILKYTQNISKPGGLDSNIYGFYEF